MLVSELSDSTERGHRGGCDDTSTSGSTQNWDK